MLLSPADARTDAEASDLRRGLVAETVDALPAAPARVEELFAADESLWRGLAAAFRTDPRALDGLLLRLHYARDAGMDADRRERVLRFLSVGYALSDDVRYLNEFLWFNGDPRHPYAAVNALSFRDNLDVDGTHRFPLADRATLSRGVDALLGRDVPPLPPRLPARVAVLGPPIAFGALHAALRREGCVPSVYDLPAAGGGWRRRLKANRLLRRAYYAARGSRVPYRAVPHPPAGERAARLVRGSGCEVAVHQLPFIIRRNLIEAFPLGILNDHLGVLPFVRGRSSLEFSLLYGLPPAATVHLVDLGVDTGPLLRGYVYPQGDPPVEGMEALKRSVLRGRDARLLDVLRYLGAGGRRMAPNARELGLQHFTIHPELIRYLEVRVVPRLAAAGDLPTRTGAS